VGRRRQSSAGPAEPAPEAESSAWPLAAGGALAASILLAGVAAKRERLVARVQACVEESGPQGLASDGASLLQIGGLMLAFSLAQLPVDELKLRLLASGAVQQWGQLVASFEADVQQTAQKAGVVCDIHIFDPTLSDVAVQDMERRARRYGARFHAIGIAAVSSKVKGKAYLTLGGMMQQLGHVGRRLDILKVE